MARYAIWNKKDPILTPVGEVLSAEKWIERYPIAGLDNITVVCAGGEINGAFFGTLGQLVEMYTERGCDFYGCVTAQQKIDVIEAYENSLKQQANEAQVAITAEERIAAALEAQVLMSLPDEE